MHQEQAILRTSPFRYGARYAERGYRSAQNYVGSVVRWQTVVDYIPPPRSTYHVRCRAWRNRSPGWAQNPWARRR